MPDHHSAQLDWDENGQPLSRAYGDVYFSRASGLAETHHVFLDGNQLPRRFAALPAGGRLCIGETGFGTGLNFLCAWRQFQALAPADARLHFVSVEKYPLRRDDLARALALWDELRPWSEQLLAQYHAIHPGFQRLLFDGGRVVLTLLVGDVLETLPELDARIDAWFLDGFAPSRNGAMWSTELMQRVHDTTRDGGSFATYAAAGFVRRNLAAAGFAVERRPGFAGKREMLCGIRKAA